MQRAAEDCEMLNSIASGLQLVNDVLPKDDIIRIPQLSQAHLIRKLGASPSCGFLLYFSWSSLKLISGNIQTSDSDDKISGNFPPSYIQCQRVCGQLV